MTLGELFTLLGYVTGVVVFLWASGREKFDRNAMLWLVLSGVFFGGLGARIAQHLFGATTFASLLSTEAGGRTILAGILCGWLGVELAKRRLGLHRSTGGAFALSLAAGEAVGRIGCHFNTCCYGRVWDGPLAVFQRGAERFPVQLLTAIYAAVMFFFLLHMRKSLDSRALFRLYLVLFATGRFWLEFLRGGSPTYGPLSVAQWVCIEIVVGVMFLAWIAKRSAASSEAV